MVVEKQNYLQQEMPGMLIRYIWIRLGKNIMDQKLFQPREKNLIFRNLYMKSHRRFL